MYIFIYLYLSYIYIYDADGNKSEKVNCLHNHVHAGNSGVHRGYPRCLLLMGNVFIFNKTRIDAVF